MSTQFGDKLYLHRHTRRLLQKEVALEANIDPSYLASIESGRRPPPDNPIFSQITSALRLSDQEIESLITLAQLDRVVLYLTKTTNSLRGGECLIQLANALPELSDMQISAMSSLIQAMRPERDMKGVCSMK